MKYDFDSRIDRTSSGCLKWNTWPGAIPMWVADMDFRSPPPIVEALRSRIDHGLFGKIRLSGVLAERSTE
jgi:cystathionine beta-lyase